MLNALKAMTAELPRFPHPIQPLVKSARLDAYRARQIAPATPMPKETQAKVERKRHNLPRRRRLHNGRLPKLNRGRG